jgi:diguanylate cyclase (GGDEF)-like protein
VRRAGLDHSRRAVEAARAAAHPYREAISVGNFGMLLGLGGEFDAADVQLDRSLDLSTAHGYRPLALATLKDAADLLLLRGDPHTAIARCTQALDLATEINETQISLIAHEQLSAAHEQLGDFQTALHHYREYHRIEHVMHSDVANRRAKILTHRFELHNARLEADKARLEARLAMLRSHELEAEKQALQMRATELGRHANEDPLTGLWNRRHMNDQFPELYTHAQETSRPLSVAIGDVDRFKDINDQFGHATGDQVLQHLAATLGGGCRPGDMVARIGGEEFFLAFIDTGLPAARATCERLRKAVEDYDWDTIEPGLAVTISFGIAESAGTPDHHQLLARADNSLYTAKRGGRNRVEPPANLHDIKATRNPAPVSVE